MFSICTTFFTNVNYTAVVVVLLSCSVIVVGVVVVVLVGMVGGIGTEQASRHSGSAITTRTFPNRFQHEVRMR